MVSKPSDLKIGDMVIIHVGDQPVEGRVVSVVSHGAFVGECDQHGVRTLTRQAWCPNDMSFIEEVNGESVFEL